jgi:putative transposase
VDSKRTRHSAYHIAYHFVWLPKFGRPVLRGGIPKRLVAMLYAKTEELGGEILTVTVQPDPIHLVGSFPPTLAPYQIRYRLKGFTAHELRQDFPGLKSRLPSVWTRAYSVGTAGNVSAATIQKYLEGQTGT